MTLTIGSLCSGAGLLDLAVMDVLDASVAWHAQYDPDDRHQYAARILAHHWPDVPNHGDITSIDWDRVEPIDILTAGFPCQPVSAAGKRLGDQDDRWLWPDVAAAVRALRPRLVFLENVSAILVRGFGSVADSLAALGYDFAWTCLRASDVGAPHRRERWFCLGWPAPGGSAAPDADGAACSERRLPAPGQTPSRGAWPDTGRRGRALATDTALLGHRHSRQAGVAGVSAAAVAGSPAYADGGRLGSGERDLRAGEPDPEGRIAADANDAGTFPQPDGEPAPSEGLDEHAELDPAGRVLDWGDYGPAIARWEHVLMRPVPDPTEPGRTGERLAPRFVEWMMGAPEGHIADVPGIPRNAQLKAAGNGVVRQQGAEALRRLLARREVPAHA